MFRVKVALWREGADLLPELVAGAQELWLEPQAWLEHTDLAATPKRSVNQEDQQHRAWSDDVGNGSDEEIPQETEDHGNDDEDENEGGENDDHYNEHETIETFSKDSGSRKNRRRRLRALSAGTEPVHENKSEMRHQPKQRRHSIGDSRAHGKALPENDFWVSEDTTFAELCEDAMRYFLRNKDNASQPKLMGTLVNAHLVAWGLHDRVLARLDACPSEIMRQVVLKVSRLRPWEQERQHKSAASGSPSVERSAKRAGASDFSFSSASSSPARANRQVSTLQSPSRGVWRQAPSRKTPLRESIHHNLRGIFAAYSLRGHHAEDGAISLQSFLQFISECHIPIPRERATLIYVSARCKNYDGFLSMLLRLAQVTHGSTCRSELAALEALLNEHIAPHTVRWDTWKTAGCPPESLFLQIEHSTRLQALLESVTPALQHAFDAYCVRDPQASVRKDRTSHERFLTLGQFQLLTQDFDLFAAGTYLDARIASRIYVTCCEHHNRSSSPIGQGHGSSGKMGWPAFLQALVRLAIVLAIPLEIGHQGNKDDPTDHARKIAAQRRDRHFAHVALRYPDLALKGLLQQLHFNVFGRPAKLRELCGRLENRHWRRGPVTPLGSQTDIIACAQKLAKVFTPLWDADGGPADYFVLFAEEVREHARSEANATRSMRGPAAGLGRLRGPHDSNEDSGERKETSHFLLMSPSVSTMPSTLASASRESSLPPAATDPTKAKAKYMEEACQQAEEAMLEAAEKFARRAEACAQITQMERSVSAHEAEHAMSDCVQLYKVATLRFRAALRSFDNLSDGEIATTKWRWAVSILGFGLRLQSSCLAGLPSQQQQQQPRRPFAGGWGFCSWEAILQPSARPAKRGPQYVRACASFIELCEFARACVENAEELVAEVSRWRQQQAAARKHAKAGQKSKQNQEQEQREGHDRGASGDEDNAGDGKEEDGDDEDEELESCVVIDDGPNAHPEILYQLGLDRASAFRLLGSLRMISLRFQLMSPGTRYAGGAAWDSGRFFRAVARSALAADHLFGCSALAYERIRFSKHFRISLLNNWSFVLFERAQVKALAKAALHRAIQLETTQSKTEGRASSTNIVSATRLDRPIQEALARSRQLIGLGFELALPSHANREWLLPVALLWTWTNCIDLAGLTAVSLSVLVANAVTPRREEADCQSASMENSASEMHIFALEASEVSRVLTERARLALISLFDSVKTQMAELQDPEALPEQAVRALLRRIFAWDKNEYYIQLVSTAMKSQDTGKLTLAQFLSFMVRLALEDPIGFAKTLYQGDVLQRFEVEDARPTRKVPTSLFIASLLYPSFAESARARRHRRSYIRRLSTTPSPLMFQDDHSAAHHGGALKDQTELVEAAAAVPENSLVDHFVVLDAREFAMPDELQKLSSLAEAQLAPRVRTVWPPTVEGVLEEEDDLARGRFSLEQLAGFRALHEQAPMPLDLVGFCFRKEKYSLMGVRPGESAAQTSSTEASVTPMVLTDGMGTRRYAVILTFWEELDPHEALREYNRDGAVDHLLATSGSRKWLAPTSLCILSRWPMYQTFETFLRHILRLSRMEVPLRLERYIANFISETPVPPPGTMQVQTILYDSPLYIRMPARSELPLPEVSMARLFASLSVGNILAIFACLLTEQKVALCSVDETKLTPVAEALRALLFPLDLQTIYIPVLPPSLMDFLYAPVPFFMGINSSCLDLGNSAILPAKSLQVQLETDARLARSDSGKSTTAGPLSPVLSAAAAASSLSSSGAAAAGGGSAGGSSTASSALTSAPNNGIVDVRKAPSDARLQSWVSIGGTSGAGPASRFSSRPSLRGRSNSFSTMLHSESVEPSNVDATTIPAAIEPQDVFFVDLDRNVVLTPLQHDATPLALPQLPKASGKKLRETLLKLSRQVPKAETCSVGASECSQGMFDNEDDRKVNARTSGASFASRLPKNAQAIMHDKWCHEVRQAFLGFQMRLLRNYKRCIVRKPQEIDWSFDRDAFLADHTSSRDFCNQFLSTQLVAGFVQDAIAVQNGQMHARQHDLDLFDALLGEAENRAKSNRLYSRQKKKPNSPLLDGASPSVSRTHYVPLPGSLKPSQTASGRASDGGASGPFPPASSFPILDPTLLGPRDGPCVSLLDVPRVQVPFAKVEISEFKRVASRRNLDPKMAASRR